MKRSRDEPHTGSKTQKENKDQKPNRPVQRFSRPGPSQTIHTSLLPGPRDLSHTFSFLELGSPFLYPRKRKFAWPNILRKNSFAKKLPQMPVKTEENFAKGGGTAVMEQPGQKTASTSPNYPYATSTPGNNSDDSRSSASSSPSCSSVSTIPAMTALIKSEIPEELEDMKTMIAERVSQMSIKKQIECDEQRNEREQDQEMMQKVLQLMARNKSDIDFSPTRGSSAGSSSRGSISCKLKSSPTSYLTSTCTGKTDLTPKRQKYLYPRSPRICIRKLTTNVGWEHLYEIFSNFGKIVSIELSIDKNISTPRRIAFIQYKTPEEAELAVKEMNEENVVAIDQVEISVTIVPIEFVPSPSQSPLQMKTEPLRLSPPFTKQTKNWDSDSSNSD